MNPLCSSSLHVEKVAAATFSRVSRLLLLAPLPGSKRRKVRKPVGCPPFRRTCRRSRIVSQGLRPLTIPGFLTGWELLQNEPPLQQLLPYLKNSVSARQASRTDTLC